MYVIAQAKLWSVVMMGTILLSSVSFVVQTIPAYYYDENKVFETLELICVIFFTIEYILRFICFPLPNDITSRESRERQEQESRLDDGDEGEGDNPETQNASGEATSPAQGATHHPLTRRPTTWWDVVDSRWKFVLGPMNIVDLLAIFPFYLEVILTAANNGVPPAENTGLAFVRVIRITRVFRLLKLGRHNDGMQILLLTLEESSTFLTSVLFLVLIIQVLFGAIVFFAESGVSCVIQYTCVGGEFEGKDCTTLKFERNVTRPFSGSLPEQHMLEILGLNTEWTEVPIASSPGTTCGQEGQCLDLGNYCFRYDGQLSKFNSIPAAMWWTLVTMCCVGFGDMAPLHEWGKLIGALTAITGVIVLAMPTTVIGTNFSEIYEAYYEKKAEQAALDGDDGSWDGEIDEIQGANSKHLNRLIVSKQLAAKAKTEGMPEDMIEKALHQEGRAAGDEVGAKAILASLGAMTKEMDSPETWNKVKKRSWKASSIVIAKMVNSYYVERQDANKEAEQSSGEGGGLS